jgi:hypothetical protein
MYEKRVFVINCIKKCFFFVWYIENEKRGTCMFVFVQQSVNLVLSTCIIIFFLAGHVILTIMSQQAS